MQRDLTQRFGRPEPSSIALWVMIVVVEVLVVVGYTQVANARLMVLHVYPFVWLNLGAWVLWQISPPPAPQRTRRIAGTLAGLYFLLLAYFGGMLRGGYGLHEQGAVSTEQLVTGFSLIVKLPPGYSPALSYSGYYLSSTVTPYMLLGFLALTYLVYVTILNARGSASVGLVGIFSCVGCSFPLIAALVSGGAASTVAAFVYSRAYTLSTVVFAVTVLVLYWQNRANPAASDPECERCPSE